MPSSASQRLSRSSATAQTIGDSYAASIGHTYSGSQQNAAVVRRPTRTFWQRLKEALRDAGKPATQAYAASLLGIEQPSVAEWNRPGGYPTVKNAVVLAEKANCCVEWLFTERGPKRPTPVDETAERLWNLWPQIDDITKGEIVRLAIERAPPAPGTSSPRAKSA